MLFIFGTKIREKILDSGYFQCPVCRSSQEFNLVQLRKYFTLYWIPIIPLKKIGTCIQCQQCGSLFESTILNTKN